MKTIGSLFVAGLLFTAMAAGAQPKPAGRPPEMTAEQREKMAVAHEKMAACLRSERPVSECHDELWKSCDATMGVGKCPMRGGGRRGR